MNQFDEWAARAALDNAIKFIIEKEVSNQEKGARIWGEIVAACAFPADINEKIKLLIFAYLEPQQASHD